MLQVRKKVFFPLNRRIGRVIQVKKTWRPAAGVTEKKDGREEVGLRNVLAQPANCHIERWNNNGGKYVRTDRQKLRRCRWSY